MRVTALKSGQALLDYITDERPDLVLLDIKMPVMDGFESLEKLHMLEGDLADIPVIFLTGVDTRDAVAKVMGLKPDGYILKSATKEDLLNYLHKKLGQ